MKWSYPLNEEQRAIISHKHGPLLVVAGPGSGKTLSLILLAMNLLLCDEAKPSELILCTYTEKAACDMQDRLLKIASDVGYQQDLASLRIGTIHSICKQLISENKQYRYFSGQLVHHTLEHIHRMARDGKFEDMNEDALSQIFERKFQALIQSYAFPIDSSQKAHAWQQVLRYFLQNREALHHVEAAELSIQMDKQRYILTGTIDLLVKTPAGLDLIDFKTLPRPRKNAFFLEEYEQQLHFYASAMEQSRGQRPERLFLYWTAEERKEDALMEIPYQPEKVKKMKDDLESVVENIQTANFHVRQPPDIGICQRCDIRYLCQQDRVIEI
jgi:ATP-dependent exoDNAse (exonuclease V) beta subunit